MTIRKTIPVLISALLLACPSAKENEPSQGISNAAEVDAPVAPTSTSPLRKDTLLLPIAHFGYELMADGTKRPKPLPAKLLMLQKDGKADTLEDDESRVFHKAFCQKGPEGAELITIGGSEASLKRWRFKDGKFEGETLFTQKFGGKWDRLRDIEVGDVDGDGEDEWVVATHDQGVVLVFDFDDKGMIVPTEIDRAPSTFVHEIELGDVDQDGAIEIYATPSKPNRAGASQAGIVRGYRYSKGKYEAFEVASFKNSHAKEILVSDLDGDKKDELYAALEAELDPATKKEVRPVRIVRLDYIKGRGSFKEVEVAKIPGGIQARVLLAADPTGRGQNDLLVSTKKGGIWRVYEEAGGYRQARISSATSGFEHAMGAYDLDGDGKVEIYAVGDDQDRVQRLTHEDSLFVSEWIYDLGQSDLTWNVGRCTF